MSTTYFCDICKAEIGKEYGNRTHAFKYKNVEYLVEIKEKHGNSMHTAYFRDLCKPCIRKMLIEAGHHD